MFFLGTGAVLLRAERSTLSPGSAGPNLHDNRFGMETWHTGCQEVTAEKKKCIGGKRAAEEEVKGQLAALSIILTFEFTGSMCWGF